MVKIGPLDESPSIGNQLLVGVLFVSGSSSTETPVHIPGEVCPKRVSDFEGKGRRGGVWARVGRWVRVDAKENERFIGSISLCLLTRDVSQRTLVVWFSLFFVLY